MNIREVPLPEGYRFKVSPCWTYSRLSAVKLQRKWAGIWWTADKSTCYDHNIEQAKLDIMEYREKRRERVCRKVSYSTSFFEMEPPHARIQ